MFPPSMHNASTPIAVTITPSQALVLLLINVLLIAVHFPICIATYRISRHTDTFILFFSETLTNTLALCCSTALAQVLALAMGPEESGLLMTRLLLTLPQGIATYPSMLHHLLIAANRAFSVLFPLLFKPFTHRSFD